MEPIGSSEVRAIVESAGRFAREVIAAKSAPEGSDAPPTFPLPVLRASAEVGYLTGPLAEDLGGAGLDTFSLALVFETLARAAAAPAAVLAFHGAALLALVPHAAAAGVRPWLERLAREAVSKRPPLAAIAIPETVVDLDRPAHPRISSREGEVRISGDYLCLPDPEFVEKVVLVGSIEGAGPIAFLDAAICLPRRRPAHPGSGLEGCPVSRLQFDDFPIGEEALLPPSESAAAGALDRLRIFLSAIAIGAAAQAAREARSYAHERIQTGRPIIAHQEVARVLEGMDTALEAARSLLQRAASAEPSSRDPIARRAYRFCTETAETVCLDAVQTLGGYGYMRDYGIEKRLRDVKSLQVLLGSTIEDWLG